MEIGASTPILRSYDEAKAKAFYIDFLEFQIDFEHRFEPHMPLYLGISKGDCKIHLSEHNGDCSPGGALRIPVTPIAEYHKLLLGKNHPNCKPSLHEKPWGSIEIDILDPFHNRLTFFETIEP